MHDVDGEPIDHLSKVDPVMRRLIQEIGPVAFKPKVRCSPFESLARLPTTSRQSSRGYPSAVRSAFPRAEISPSDELLAMRVGSIRETGFSRPKITALRDLAFNALDGTVPKDRIIKELANRSIVRRLIEVRGIGRWRCY